ncbi:MAG: methyl-accepting chemotaxis protein [Lachnospiraceae bacterium]|nr:methyl-accepting chemotaxis protein [Lachnospiraceae bacterium]
MKKIFSIRNKIYLCFLIPIVFMALIGYVAYDHAAKGMSEQFLTASKRTMNMVTEYLDLNTSLISAETISIAFEADLQDYLLGMPGQDKIHISRYYDDERNDLSVTQVSHPIMDNIHIITREKMDMITTATTTKIPGIFETYKEDVLSKSENPNIMDKWITSHPLIDEALSLKPDSYFLACQQKASSGMGCVVIDINTGALADLLREVDFAGKSYVGLIAPDGKELAVSCADGSIVDSGTVFADKPFYESSLSSEELTGSSYVGFNGEEYLFMYQRSEDSAISLCALIPSEIITKDAEKIKQITVYLVIISTLIAFIIGSLIAGGIQKNMKRISGKLDEVANGNLSVSVKAKGHDEFQGLAKAAGNMIANNKKLVEKLSGTADELALSAVDVSEASKTISGFSSDITDTIDEISDGLKKQTEHAEECVRMTGSLSERINDITISVSEVENIIDETEHLIRKGEDIVENLAGRTAQTSELTRLVGASIDDLKGEILSITGFVDTINSISGQTNLLSLNASIEAARAGEAGRGFAVVAEEIRNLADNSSEAAEEISRKVNSVSDQTKVSVQSAENAENMVELQAKAVSEVTEIFESISVQMKSLFNALKRISENTELADKERMETVEAVDSISAIIDTTTSSSDRVRDMALGLMDNVEKLGGTAEILDQNMNGLKNEISAFTIE